MVVVALNEKEEKIIDLIRDNPFISQKELSEKIGLSRSAVANMISGLVKKGHLLGKAYVINENRPIVCIGGANLDTRYIVKDQLRFELTNEVDTRYSVGGVARNIAENLGRLEEDVQLFSIVGNDMAGHLIKSSSKEVVDLREIEVIENQKTGSFIEVLDQDENVVMGMADVEIYNQLTTTWVIKHIETIKRAKFIVVDTNCPKETTEYLMYLSKEKGIQMIIVTASIQKVFQLPDDLSDVVIYSKNNEIEAYLDQPVQTDEELKQAAQFFVDKGVEAIIIAKDSEKTVYACQDKMKIYHNPFGKNKTYEWGTNEAMCAAVIHYQLKGEDIETSIRAGLLNGYYTAQEKCIVRPNLSVKRLQMDLEKYEASK